LGIRSNNNVAEMFGVYCMEAHAKSKYNELADLAAWQEIVKV